eukprot:4898141-Amphidinium_carterae.1
MPLASQGATNQDKQQRHSTTSVGDDDQQIAVVSQAIGALFQISAQPQGRAKAWASDPHELGSARAEHW